MSDHLSPDRLQHFHSRLLDAKSSIEQLLAQTSGDTRVDVSGSTIGRLTRMDAIQVQAISQMSRRQLDVRLQQIAASLQAMENGTYGICRHCKEPVALQRLEALPEAPFCVECQESFE